MSSRPKKKTPTRSAVRRRDRPAKAGAVGPFGPKIRVCAFIQRGATVLLVRQRRGDSTYWLLPGGGVERGETLALALEREIREECGVEARSAGSPLAVVQTISPDHGLTRHLVQIVFPVDLVEGQPQAEGRAVPAPTDEAIEQIAWFDAEAVRRLVLHPPIQELVASWLDPERGVGASPSRPCVVTDTLWAPE